MRASLLRIIAIVFAVALARAALAEIVVEATPLSQTGISTSAIELSVTLGDKELHANWEITGDLNFSYMSIQWREESSADWGQYDLSRVSFCQPGNCPDKNKRDYTINFNVKYDEDAKDWITVDLNNGTEYQVRVWIEFSDRTVVISNVVAVSPGEPEPTPTSTNTPTPTHTATPTPSATPTTTPMATHTPTPTPTDTPTTTPSPTPTHTATIARTVTVTHTATATPTSTPTATSTPTPAIELSVTTGVRQLDAEWQISGIALNDVELMYIQWRERSSSDEWDMFVSSRVQVQPNDDEFTIDFIVREFEDGREAVNEPLVNGVEYEVRAWLKPKGQRDYAISNVVEASPIEPTATPTATPMPTVTVTPTPTETPMPAPTGTFAPTAMETPTLTATPTQTQTRTPTVTPTPTGTSTATPTATSTPVPAIELSVTAGDVRLDAKWELVGISEFKDMSIQWREQSSDDWKRYVSPRVSFSVPAESNVREFGITQAFDKPLVNGKAYQVRVWTEKGLTDYVISNVVVASPNGPTPTPTARPTETATVTPTPTATATPMPTNTPTPTATSTPTPSATHTQMPTATFTASPTNTPTPSPTATFTPTITPTPTSTFTPTPTYTATQTATPIPLPTATNTPTPIPTGTPMAVTPDPTETATVRLVGTLPSGEGEVRFHVRDGSLGTIHSCVATWDGLLSSYHGLDEEVFNLWTGEPETEVFSVNDDCAFTLNDDFRLIAELWDAFEDGKSVSIGPDPVNFAETAAFDLYTNIEAGSRFEVRFYFHIADSYPSEDKRVHVKSKSDVEGEWADLKEVRSELDAKPSADSGLFLGMMKVSRDPDAKGEGDGSVWVPLGERVKVTYLDEEGVVKADSDTSPPPTPTPAVKPSPTNVPGRYGDPYPTLTPTKVPGAMKRKVEVKFANTPQRSGDTAVFHISDNYLGTTGRCTVKWTDIPRKVDANRDRYLRMSWNVFTGDPLASVFSREGCEYDGATPIKPIVAFVDDDERYPSSEFPSGDSPHGLVSIAGEAPKGSTVKITFDHDVVDAYPAEARRARVYSSSDREGEWVALREVASKSDASPAAASGLYRGEVEISEDPASKGAGDGRVFVRTRSRLSVVYYDVGGGAEPKTRASVGLDLPTPTPSPSPTATPLPTPTPIPAVNPLLLILGVGVAILIVLIDRRRIKAQKD